MAIPNPTKTKTKISSGIALGVVAVVAVGAAIAVGYGIISGGLPALLNVSNTDLVSNWNFDSLQNSVLFKDVTKSGSASTDGFLTNQPTSAITNTMPDFIKGSALILNGTDYGKIIDNSGQNPDPKGKTDCNVNNSCKVFPLDITGDITISAWVKRNSGSGYAGILTKWAWTKNGAAVNDRSYELVIDNNNTFALAVSKDGTDAGTTKVNATSTVAVGKWYHVVGVRSGSSLSIYVNGVKQATQTFNGSSIFSGQASVIFGAYNEGDLYYLKGFIDEVKIYKRALSATEVRNLYITDAQDERPDLLAGKLTVTAVGSHGNYWHITQGDKAVDFIGLTLNTMQSEKDVDITQLKLKIKTSDQSYPGLISNIRLYDSVSGIEIVPNGINTTDPSTWIFNFNPAVLRLGTMAKGLKGIKVVADVGHVNSNVTIAGNNDNLAIDLPENSVLAQDSIGTNVVPTVFPENTLAGSILPVIISNMRTCNVTQNYTTVTFHVEGRINSTPYLSYGIAPAHNLGVFGNASNVKITGYDASVQLSDLTASTTYNYLAVLDRGTRGEFTDNKEYSFVAANPPTPDIYSDKYNVANLMITPATPAVNQKISFVMTIKYNGYEQITNRNQLGDIEGDFFGLMNNYGTIIDPLPTTNSPITPGSQFTATVSGYYQNAGNKLVTLYFGCHIASDPCCDDSNPANNNASLTFQVTP